MVVDFFSFLRHVQMKTSNLNKTESMTSDGCLS